MQSVWRCVTDVCGSWSTKALTVFALAVMLVCAGAGAQPVCAAGPITGTVFRDYNANGVQDAAEPGAGGVKVAAYDAQGSPCGSTTSQEGGPYTLQHTCATTTVRLEFTTLPAWAKSGPEGKHSGTSVQFVAATATGVRFGINNPADYCQEDPFLCTSIAQLGDQISGDYRGEDTLTSAGNDWGTDKGRKADDWQVPKPPVQIAVASQTGTLYGLAWRRSTNTLYAGAYFKQFAGFGPNGAGAIYRVAVDPETGDNTGAPELFVDVNNFANVDVSCPAHDTDLDWPPKNSDARWDAVGKCSLGDLDISDDEKTLYAMDLKGRQVLAISAESGLLLGRWPVPTSKLPILGGTCPAEDVRPFGLGFKDGTLYVGAVCSAQSTVTGTDNGDPQALHAYVWTLDAGTGASSLILDYQMVADRSWWNPWKSTQAQAKTHAVGLPNGWAAHPQPMLADIEFFGDDLTLGFRDRFGDQWGSSSDWGYVLGDGNGDIKCASWDEGSSSYIMERDGICGSRRAKGAPPGPGMGDDPTSELYWGDGHNKTLGPGDEYEDEFSMGALAQFGTEPLAATQIDLSLSFGYTIYDVGGIIWHDNLQGTPLRGYAVYDSRDDQGTFRKANGLGDLEALCEPAPLEIGNRLWDDTDWDGIQDPGEAGLDKVTVQLWVGSIKVGEAQTTSDGQYYFGGIEQRNMLPCGSALTAGASLTPCEVEPNQAYEIRILLDGPNLAGRIPTIAEQGSDLHNSDCAGGHAGGGHASIYLVTGGAGANDHTFDCGLLELYRQYLPLILRMH